MIRTRCVIETCLLTTMLFLVLCPARTTTAVTLRVQSKDCSSSNKSRPRLQPVAIEDQVHNSPFVDALIRKDIDKALALLNSNADIQTRDERKTHVHATPLMLALLCEKCPPRKYRILIETLLKRGSDVNARDDYRMTPLMVAARVNIQKPENDMFPVLIKYGADPLAKDYYDNTVLSFIVSQRLPVAVQLSRLRLIISKMVDINARDKSGQTALMHATVATTPAVVQYLVDHGADVKQTCPPMNWNALHWACSRGANVEVVQVLLDNGSDLCAVDAQGQQPLAMAAHRGYTKIVRLLLRRGASLDAKDADESTALMLASGARQVDTVGLLLREGASVNAQNKVGLTPLMWAILRIDPPDATEDGDLPYGPDKSLDNLSTIKLLVRFGADLNMKSNDGKNVTEMAAGLHPDIAKYLKATSSKH